MVNGWWDDYHRSKVVKEHVGANNIVNLGPQKQKRPDFGMKVGFYNIRILILSILDSEIFGKICNFS